MPPAVKAKVAAILVSALNPVANILPFIEVPPAVGAKSAASFVSHFLMADWLYDSVRIVFRHSEQVRHLVPAKLDTYVCSVGTTPPASRVRIPRGVFAGRGEVPGISGCGRNGFGQDNPASSVSAGSGIRKSWENRLYAATKDCGDVGCCSSCTGSWLSAWPRGES